ncbi:hypothetical protein TNCV_179611 [Trichonephila clavipes]|nr:hypothetical protein TNCV_179611 [Trichonephila clavipes]
MNSLPSISPTPLGAEARPLQSDENDPSPNYLTTPTKGLGINRTSTSLHGRKTVIPMSFVCYERRALYRPSGETTESLPDLRLMSR